MGIHRDTLNEWCKQFPAISDALKQGKAPVDIEVENMLLKRAMGFEYEEVTTEIEDIPTGKLDEKGNPIYRQRKHIKKTKKMVVPDTTAQIFWLKNRRPDLWRDRHENDVNIVTANHAALDEAFEALKGEAQ
jgi:hypothetical protein